MTFWIAAYLYLIPAIFFYRGCLRQEMADGYDWIVPSLLWPIFLPIHMLSGDDLDD